MKERIRVFVYARDPISEAGLVSQLRSRPEVWVVDEGQLDAAEVAVVVADQVDEETLRARIIEAACCRTEGMGGQGRCHRRID